MAGVIAWIQANGAMFFGVLFAISEAIGMIPSIKASGVFQSIYNVLKWMKENIFKGSAA